MSDLRKAAAAFESYAAKFDTHGDEWQDMGSGDYFKAGYMAALTELEQSEPVTDEENERFSQDVSDFKGADPEATKYALEQFLKNRAAPPRREPLTDERALQIAKEQGWMVHHSDIASDAIELIRAIEAAHGVGGKP